MGNKQLVKEYIIKQDPSILELKFGCEVKIKNDIGIFINEFYNSYYIFIKRFPTSQVINKEIKIEILGRPITLFDIKRCLDYNKATIVNWLKISNKWEAPDNLDNQSEELINLLYETFKSKIHKTRNEPNKTE